MGVSAITGKNFSPISRLVYRWFLLVYQITYALGIIGYTILLLLFTGLGLVFPGGPDVVMEFGVILIFYGIYFGVMGRDCAVLCVDYMAAGMTVSSQVEFFISLKILMTSCSIRHRGSPFLR